MFFLPILFGSGFSSTVLNARVPGSSNAVGTVFVIPMENHNWTQPGSMSSPAQIFGNAAAPYINSLVTPGNPNATLVSYATNYLNVAAGIHPSEPNYIWSEAGTNFGILNDNDPYPSNVTQTTLPTTFAATFRRLGISWRSYQEDTDLATNGSGQLTNTPLSPSQFTVPLVSFSGSGSAYTNAYNGTHNYAYAAKHNPQVFFTDTNGGDNTTSSNSQKSHYAPLQQLQTDLTNNTVAAYNWITPDLYNDMHTALPGSFSYAGRTWTGDQAGVAQGDNFLSMVVPMIMASQAFQNNGVIVIWNDETEGGDSSAYTIMEIVVSPLAKGNAYASSVSMSHSSDLRTWQEVWGIGPGIGFGAANGANDLSDLFVPSTIPPLAEVIDPDTMAPGPGCRLSGSLSSLYSFDTSTLEVISNLSSLIVAAPDQLILNGVAPSSTASDLRFDIVAHSTTSGISQSILLYNWTTSQYDVVSTRQLPTTDTPTEVVATNPNAYIEPGTNAVRAEINWRPTSLGQHSQFDVFVNQAIWKVQP